VIPKAMNLVKYLNNGKLTTLIVNDPTIGEGGLLIHYNDETYVELM